MKIVGIISDTHGFVEPRIYDFFDKCDEIWHAGDIGSVDVFLELSMFKPLKAVYGNTDGWDVRGMCPLNQRFLCEKVDVLMTHIGGYPGRYESEALSMIKSFPPKLFISGHSHILKVMNCSKFGLLHINPGAMGNSGIHQVKTAVRLVIDGANMRDLKVLELPRRH